MEYILENEYLKVTVTTRGAQVKSLIRKSDGVEHIWCGDPEVWEHHAPILFPCCGRLKDSTLEAKDQVATNCIPHGFDRTMEHKMVFCGENSVVMELTETPQTLALWPYRFRLVSTITLEGDTIHHTLTVENHDEEEMPFGIGFHPAFAIPFDDKHQTEDYVIRFDNVESPICLGLTPDGLVDDTFYYLGKNIREVPVSRELFSKGSHFMTGLSSRTMGLFEQDTGRGVVMSIRNFPYVVLWAKGGMEPRFVCMEPWHSTPSPANGSSKWEEKPAAAILAPGQEWSTTLSTSFVR